MAQYFQRAMLANGIVCALRLHQRVPEFRFSRHHLALLLQEDSAHYLIYSLIFLASHPITSMCSSYIVEIEIIGNTSDVNWSVKVNLPCCHRLRIFYDLFLVASADFRTVFPLTNRAFYLCNFLRL